MLEDEGIELADLERMLEFLYTGNFWEHPKEHREDGLKTRSEIPYHKHRYQPQEDCPPNYTQRSNNSLVVLFRMFAIADTFGIRGLEDVTLKKMQVYRDLATQKVRIDALDEDGHHRSNYLGDWKRIMEALEFCYATFGSSPHMNQLADLLLQPLARMAPVWLGINYDRTRWSRQDLWKGVMMGQNAWWLKDLLRRLDTNPAFSSRLFQIICFEAVVVEQERLLDPSLDDRNRLRAEIEKTLHIAAFVLRDPTKADLLRCRRNEARDNSAPSFEGCESDLPMVPCWCPSNDSSPRLTGFKCLECNDVVEVEKIVGGGFALEEMGVRFPVKSIG